MGNGGSLSQIAMLRDIAVFHCKLPDVKSRLERLHVGSADGRHQDFLVYVNTCADGTLDVPIRRIDDPYAIFHHQETQFLRGVRTFGFEIFSLVSSVFGCQNYILLYRRIYLDKSQF